MKLGVVGLGLGHELAWHLASKGHDVVGVDIRKEAIEKREPPLVLSPLHQRPRFSTKYEDLKECEYLFVFVSTPFDRATERLSLANVLNAIASAQDMNPWATYLVLSTLPIGGMAEISKRFPKLRTLYCPPMVKKVDFLRTFVHPPSGWQMIGTPGWVRTGSGALALGTPHVPDDVVELYRGLLSDDVSILVRPDYVVEIAKLCTNLVLSTKIVLANAIAEWTGDPETARMVCEVVGKDPRIGEGYFTPGGPAAGPCFPRDLIELQTASREHDLCPDCGTGLARILDVLNKINGTRELVES